MSQARRNLGTSGEELATTFLRRKGYDILAQNFRTRSGEIDIIAFTQNTIVFIEVKTTKSGFLNSPLDAITHRKQRQISKVALEYLGRKDLFDHDARFDVIAVTVRSWRKTRIEHIENAFDLDYG